MSVFIPFYKESKESVASSINSRVRHIKQHQDHRLLLNLRNVRLYSITEAVNYGYFSQNRMSALLRPDKLSYNLVYSVIDTWYNKMVKSKPLPMFITDAGSWSNQRKARKANKFIESVFNQTKYYQYQNKMIKDSGIYGTGMMKIFRKGKKIKLERVLPSEIFVDENESFYGEPRTLHQVKYIHRDVLKGMFPKKATDIELAEAAADDFFKYLSTTSYSNDMIEVWETWHLSSGPKAKDGRKCITMGDILLDDQEYEYDYFPFLKLDFDDSSMGYWARGIAEILTGIQIEINRVLQHMQKVLHLLGNPKWLVDASTQIIPQHFINENGTFIKYTGKAPELQQFNNILGGDWFNWIGSLEQKGFGTIGISQLSAQSIKPAGLDSGKALRVYNDFETERYSAYYQKLEECSVQAAKIMLDLCDEIAEEFGDFEVKATSKNAWTEKINWKDIAIDKDSYELKIFPISALSKTPSSRLQEVKEMMEMGLMPQDYAQKLLQFPDLDEYYEEINAPYEDIMACVDKIVYDEYKEDIEELYNPPEAYQNLQLGIFKFQRNYLRLKHTDIPMERLELLQRWIVQAEYMLSMQEQPQIAQAQAQGKAPVVDAQGMPVI